MASSQQVEAVAGGASIGKGIFAERRESIPGGSGAGILPATVVENAFAARVSADTQWYDSGVLNNRRLINLAGFLACIALLAYALYTQYYLGLEPCPLCIFQRIGIAAVGVVFLIAALHHPKGWGAYVYAVLIGVAALATVGVAARHVYVQSLPPGSIPSCGAPLEVLLQFTPVTEVIRKVLTGSGECGEVNWKFLGLAMPAWVLICAVVLGVVGVMANIKLGVSPKGSVTRAGSAAR